ncbi:MAG: DUF481 domain-containing protein [Myxococcales bacterium]|nr:MAG: DUF481 domain-containing protein [Myxococcales bacterium]
MKHAPRTGYKGKQLALLVGALSSCGFAQSAAAQAAPVVSEAVHHSEAVQPVPEEFSRETLLNLAGGASLSTGNTRAFSANGGARFNLKRERHQLTAEAGIVYGLASLRDTADLDGDGNVSEFNKYQLNARNVTGRVRYDFFLTDDDAVFASFVPRWDTFAGLDLRLQNQVGYMRNFFRDDGNHRFWGELGYDVTYDNWTTAAGGGDQVNHSARGFLGYDNHINEMVTFITGVEGLYNLERSTDWRINWNSELTSKLSDAFQTGVRFSLAYDHQPVPGAKSLDTTTTINLLYAMDFEASSKVVEEPAAVCDCEPQKAEAVNQALEAAKVQAAKEVAAAAAAAAAAAEKAAQEQSATPEETSPAQEPTQP